MLKETVNLIQAQSEIGYWTFNILHSNNFSTFVPPNFLDKCREDIEEGVVGVEGGGGGVTIKNQS